MSISFRKDFGLWWPDYDHKPEACHRRVMGRVNDLDRLIGLCKRRRLCVQAGGHAGVWPEYLAKYFNHVFTFEPEPDLYACLASNHKKGHVVSLQMALGACVGPVQMRKHVSAGSWRIADNGTVPVNQVTIDSLNLEECDAIVLDVEGHEVQALRGATNTIKKFRPAIQVEELARSRVAIQAHMRDIDYKFRARMHSDAVYTR